MIPLGLLRNYWETVGARVDGISGVLPVTLDEEMGKRIRSLPLGSRTLFFLPPASESAAKSPDAWREVNQCVVFLMEKFETLRRTSYEALESTQPVIEAVKQVMLADMRAGCPVMRFDVATLSTLPETEFFAGFAGWSLGFKIIDSPDNSCRR